MKTLVADADVAAIVIRPVRCERSLRGIGKIEGPPHLLVLTSTLDAMSWERMPFFIAGVLDREGVGIDSTGFRYPAEREVGEDPLPGVEVYNPLGECYLSLNAFESLILRFVVSIRDGAERAAHPIVRSEWWANFGTAAGTLRSRVEIAQMPPG